MKKLLLTMLMLDIVGMASADIVPGKTYRMASAANEGRVMFVDNSSFANNTSVVMWTDTEVPAQQWEAIANDNGTFSFRNVFTGKYLARNSAVISTNSKYSRRLRQAVWVNGMLTLLTDTTDTMSSRNHLHPTHSYCRHLPPATAKP